MFIAENHIIAPHTTFGLGGRVRYFSEVRNGRDLVYSLDLAKENNVPVFILGSGSNVLFPDDMLDLFVIHMAIPGITVTGEFKDADGTSYVKVRVQGGQDWDDFVLYSLKAGLSGAQCLSGIPGTAGAAIVQNIGAYGAEVSSLVDTVIAMDTDTREVFFFSKEECGFAYRSSRFKGHTGYIIMGAEFRLKKNASPRIHHQELRNHIKAKGFDPDNLKATPESHLFVRDCVLEIRESKGMIYKKDGSGLRSAGSFFKNPVVTGDQLAAVKRNLTGKGLLPENEELPAYPEKEDAENNKKFYKIPAAFLIEKCGFPKGFSEGGAGISPFHSLCLVNLGGTSRDIRNLALKIREKVAAATGIDLEPEVIIL